MPVEPIDAQRFGRVGVLYGGVNAEREVSKASGENVLAAIKAAGIEAVGIEIGEDPIAQLTQQPLDRVFNVLHGKHYEDGQLQGVLAFLKLPTVGSGVLASALTFNKITCKQLWAAAGLATPPLFILTPTTPLDAVVDAVGFPFVIKPASEGSSVGVHIVREASEYACARDDALRFDKHVMAEAFIDGGEYTVSFVNDEPLPIIKIETPDAPFYNYYAKYTSDATQFCLPCGLTEAEISEVNQLAQCAYQAAGCCHFARVDVMRDSQGTFHLIELNTLPGMTAHSLLPKAAAFAGISMQALVVKLLENTLPAVGAAS